MAVESVDSIGFHTLLSIQNVLFYLTSFLSQKLLTTKNQMLTLNFNICLFMNENNNLNEDETSIFIQYCHLFCNNLTYLHLNEFNKKVAFFFYIVTRLSFSYNYLYRLIPFFRIRFYLTQTKILSAQRHVIV